MAETNTIDYPIDETFQDIREHRCPVLYALDIVGQKWKLPILWYLHAQENTRYNELKRRVAGITNMMLTKSLRELEADGLVARTVYDTIPPKVEYALTDNGAALLPALNAPINGARRRWREKTHKKTTCHNRAITSRRFHVIYGRLLHGKSRLRKKRPIIFRFLLELHRIGARGGRQARDEEAAVAAARGDRLARLDVLCLDLGVEQGEQNLRRLAARRADTVAVRNVAEHGGDVDGLDDVEIGVGGVAVPTDGALHRRAGGDALLREERFDAVSIECLCALRLKVLRIAEENQSIDAPHIVLEVRIVERHRAFFRTWREAPHHHDRRIGGQKRRKGAQFYFLYAVFHPIPPKEITAHPDNERLNKNNP